MKKSNLLLSFVVFISLSSCSSNCCREKYSCPGLSNEAKSWIPSFYEGDTIGFSDSLNNRYKFIAGSAGYSAAITDEICFQGAELGGTCKCPDYCNSNGYFSFRDDSLLNKRQLYYGISLYETKARTNAPSDSILTIGFNLDGFRPDFNLLDTTYANKFDSVALKFFKSIALKNKVYTNVYYLKSYKTSQDSTVGVSSIYYTKQYGIIGFFDKISKSQFYLE